jgi:glycosyltransferase involved in cell wall biosynthesis
MTSAPMTSPATPSVTVAVCTRDRPEQLGAFLSSVCSLVIPPELQWELVIVDNGSDDASAAVVDGFASSLPLRRVKAPVAGVSHARNHAVREARGDYICWADDDVILDRDWLTAYLAAFRHHPHAAVFGGRILARLEEPTPRWIRRSVQSGALKCVFAHRDFRDAARIELNRDDAPWGANFAVRAREQKQFEFDPALGLSPQHNRAGEESDVIYRILAAGGTGWWVPRSVVHHIIRGDRQSWRYFHFYFTRAGETAAYVHENFADQDEDGRRSRRRILTMSRGRLWLQIACRWALFLAASAARLSTLRVRFLAGAGFYRGVLNHRRESARHPSRIRRTGALITQEVA